MCILSLIGNVLEDTISGKTYKLYFSELPFLKLISSKIDLKLVLLALLILSKNVPENMPSIPVRASMSA